MNIIWKDVGDLLSETLNRDCRYQSHHSVSGGCINEAYVMRCDDGMEYFVKLNSANMAPMFEAELAGLQTMYESQTIRVPKGYCSGSSGNQSYIVMEALPLGRGVTGTMRQFGEKLASLHRQQQANNVYGWSMDNTIGSTQQVNTQGNNWVEFWRDRRLGFQLQLAASNGYSGELQKSGEQVMSRLDGFFTDQPPAVMLHGDLWSGNYAVCEDGEVAIFDPAFYYGDRETDIAMTELFGGFSNDFYQAYNDVYPLPTEYALRKVLYNSYHILNHLNLFGSSYLQQAKSMMQRLLSEVR